MTTIGNIGIGLLILLILWIVTIIVFVIAIKLQSNIAWIALGLSSAFTIVLLCIPTDKQYNLVEPRFAGKDHVIIYKTLILAFLIASALAGLFVLFIGYCIEPIRPKPFKSFSEN